MTKLIRTTPREVLLTRDYLFSLAQTLVALDLPRRPTAEWAEDTLFKAEEDGWIILTGEGQRIYIHEDILEETHGDDPDVTCVSDLKRKSFKPPLRRPRATTLGRLRVYDACFKLAGRPVRREDRWVETRRMRKLLGTFNLVRLGHYRKAVRDLKRRMGKRPNPILYSQAVRALRFRFAEEPELDNSKK